ncbi:hypothetical protein BO71DRAFT_431082 [Aspergillus ellipticus CBS 707.79]|uniref:Fructose-bisphosphate aldolase n=1 Tax=Aspergillus ellipticus CBS 707.79 TaxID=1448320 RepID=A0A319DPW7_9EURO|nr:hypothetical protein BO71DRAFT_431082 [Aspergillus ellipticus CBS 707.79]
MVRRQPRRNHSQDQNLHSPAGELNVQDRAPAAVAISATSQVPGTEQHRRSTPTENGGGVPQVSLSPDFTKGLTSHDLRAPVSAVHHMSTPEERTASTAGPSIASQPIDSPQKPTEMCGFLGRVDVGIDVVSNGLIEESQARKLFSLFMTHAGTFMPIFDSVVDTFDSLRAREPFCFVVILALACCVEQIPDFPETSKSAIMKMYLVLDWERLKSVVKIAKEGDVRVMVHGVNNLDTELIRRLISEEGVAKVNVNKDVLKGYYRHLEENAGKMPFTQLMEIGVEEWRLLTVNKADRGSER